MSIGYLVYSRSQKSHRGARKNFNSDPNADDRFSLLCGTKLKVMRGTLIFILLSLEEIIFRFDLSAQH